MEVKDQLKVNAPRDVVIEEMQKPEALKQVIPNCEELHEVEEHVYVAKISERISMISMDLEVDIRIEDFNPPDSFSVVIDGEAPGSNTDVRADTNYELTEAEDGGTVIDYYMDIDVSGKLASLGFRMLKSTVNKRVEQMGQNVEEYFAELPATQ